MITIDGQAYNINVIKIDRTIDYEWKYFERTQSAVASGELAGIFYNYVLNLGDSLDNPADYDRLIKKLAEYKEFHTVVVPDKQSGTFTYQAYFAGVSDSLLIQHSGKNYWTGLKLSFKAKAPRRD